MALLTAVAFLLLACIVPKYNLGFNYVKASPNWNYQTIPKTIYTNVDIFIISLYFGHRVSQAKQRWHAVLYHRGLKGFPTTKLAMFHSWNDSKTPNDARNANNHNHLQLQCLSANMSVACSVTESIHWLITSPFSRPLCELVGRMSSGAQLCSHWPVRSCGEHACSVL